MRNLFACLALFAVLGTSACAGNPVSVAPVGSVAVAPAAAEPSAVEKLSAFTVADLQAASLDAKAQNPPDVTAYQCYDFLAALVPTLKGPGPGDTVGVFVALQKARDLANGVTSSTGALKNLNLACAPLVIDTQTVVNRLLLVGAGTASAKAALGPLGALLP